MSAYGFFSVPTIVNPGDLVQVIATADPVFAQASTFLSERVAPAGPTGLSGKRLFASGTFSGAPGAFSIGVFESYQDSGDWFQVGAISTVNAANQFSLDMVDSVSGRFLRYQMASLTNNVTLQAWFGQQS
jgi:hypothetical protein